MKVASAQTNTTVGNISGNAAKILTAYERATTERAEMVLLPALTGNLPFNLTLNDTFIMSNLKWPERKATSTVTLIQDEKLLATRTKTLLLAYDVKEFKRRQAVTSLKVTTIPFGVNHRMPAAGRPRNLD